MEKIKEIAEEGRRVEKEVRERMITYLTAAFGLVAGLAWNDAIKALIEYLYPLDKNSVPAKFIYAILITLVLVFVTMYLVKVIKKEN